MLQRVAALPLRAVRRLRWRLGGWSKASDRAYHDALYSAQEHDPFRADYPGYVTIRRFADHAETLLPASGAVLDVGCGPGEITCELARRHPHLNFVGIDHSEKAIERARQNAARLGLGNVEFTAGDADTLAADRSFGLITMFDAFHHIEAPDAFLDWVRGRTTRCLLIEPAGTSTGRWARHLDLDWLLDDVAAVRDRLEAACGEASRAGAVGDATSDLGVAQGEGAVERRYALDDFERFFRGWHLRVVGTVAGFDRYPPNPRASSALGPVAGEMAYALVRSVEERLVANDRDGLAKHWVIAATSEAGVIVSRRPSVDPAGDPAALHRTVASAFDVRYERYDGPSRVEAGGEFRGAIEFSNAGWDEWRSDGSAPVRVSYHWLGRDDRRIIDFEGRRSDLPHAVKAGERCRAWVNAHAPAAPGEYVLAIDLVKEGVSWFSQAGTPWHTVTISVHRR